MPIRTFDEVDPFEIHKLGLAAFGWAAPEKRMRRQIREDPRVMDGYGRYYVERGRIVAQVLPLRIPVRLASGVETIGGIAAVCSLPEVWGRGYVRRLMGHVHDLYREEGIRIAALTTSRNIRGYGVYRKLGYVDLAPFYRATRRIRVRPSPPDGVGFRVPKARDIPRMQQLFRDFARSFFGWTERHPTFLGGEQIWFDHILDRFRLVYRGGTLVGYLRTIPGRRTSPKSTCSDGTRTSGRRCGPWRRGPVSVSPTWSPCRPRRTWPGSAVSDTRSWVRRLRRRWRSPSLRICARRTSHASSGSRRAGSSCTPRTPSEGDPASSNLV